MGRNVLGNGPHILGNGPHVLGNGSHVLGNGPHVRIMAFEVMTHSGLCHSDNSRLCCLVFSRSC